jgi:CRP-like cAMP-binding protein
MKAVNPAVASHPFLRTMPVRHLDVLGRKAAPRVFEAGQVIFREHEPANRLFLVEEGSVALESPRPGGEPVLIHTVGNGEVLGWSWLFAPFLWHFQARALARTRVLELDGAHLLVAAEEDRQLGYELMKRITQVLIQRLQATRQKLRETQAPDSPRPAMGETSVVPRPQRFVAGGPLRDIVAGHPFCHELAWEHLAFLLDCAMRVEFEAGQTLFQEGEMANRFYLLQRGKVALESRASGEAFVRVQHLGEGEVLGWSWLFPPYCWHFAARALERTEAVFFYGTRLRERCEQDHPFGYELMKRFAQVLIRRLQSTRLRLSPGPVWH